MRMRVSCTVAQENFHDFSDFFISIAQKYGHGFNNKN